MRARWRLKWWLATAVLVAALGLVLSPVRVRGPSMRPALVEGDVLLTAPLWGRDPERHELVVFEDTHNGGSAIKRVAGLPGERVQLIDGDLFVDGQRVARAVCGVEDLLPLVDASGVAADQHFALRENGFELEAEQGAWRLEGEGLGSLREPPRDGYLLRGELQTGEKPAVDLGLEVDYHLLAPSAVLLLRLQVEGGEFRLQLGDSATRVAVRRAERGEETVLAELLLPRPAPRGRLFLGNVDQRLSVCLDGRPLLTGLAYEAFAVRPLAELPPGLHFEQVAVGGIGPLRIGRLRVGRDLFRSAAGTYGGSEAFQLADDEFFLLGDDPAFSLDSRNYGPVPRARLRRVVLGRLWPPGAVGLGW